MAEWREAVEDRRQHLELLADEYPDRPTGQAAAAWLQAVEGGE